MFRHTRENYAKSREQCYQPNEHVNVGNMAEVQKVYVSIGDFFVQY
jgi:hypothetical protein